MSTYKPPYQGMQTVVACGAGYPPNYRQVNTYAGSQRGWMIKTVRPDKVKETHEAQLRQLGRMIANYEVVCTNPKLRDQANIAFLAKVLIHKGNVQ